MFLGQTVLVCISSLYPLYMYILIEMLLSFKIKFNIFVWEINILF